MPFPILPRDPHYLGASPDQPESTGAFPSFKGTWSIEGLRRQKERTGRDVEPEPPEGKTLPERIGAEVQKTLLGVITPFIPTAGQKRDFLVYAAIVVVIVIALYGVLK